MNSLLKISHPEILTFTQWESPGKVEDSSGKIMSYRSPELESPGLISCIGTFDTARSFNSIRIKPHPELRELFPNTFRFEISNDGVVWEPILHEANFRGGFLDQGEWHFSLISARMVKLLLSVDRPDASGKYAAAFGELSVMVSGIVHVEVSSELDRLWVKENLIDRRTDYGWSSALRQKPQNEFVHLDLGSINRVGEIRLLSKNDRDTFFPDSFRILYSEDSITYHHLIEETGFMAEPGTWYRWRFLPTNIRFLKLDIAEGARTREGKHVSQIIEIELYAVPDLVDKTEKSLPEPIPYASVLRSGILRMAMDGEVKEGVAVQASDRRLRDATTEAKGIVELASDGEDRENVAVQGNDRRLKYASEDLPGILRLARDGEARAGHAVQGNDSRLKPATEDEAGLVELAADGENRPGVAVQGSDHRLRISTEKAHGIVRLATDGSVRPGEAVQANDSRLRSATEEYPGIVRFARAGEQSDSAAVQGDDPRLRYATMQSAGIVELARDGEVREGAVLQSHDARIRPATESAPGIVEFCAPGSAAQGRAVQGHDPRLSDARRPLPHEHDYAAREHDFAAHTGTIALEKEMGAELKGFAAPQSNFAPVSGRNKGQGSGLLGVGQATGVLGAGESAGMVALGLKEGQGLLAAADAGAGARVLSQKGYSLVAGAPFRDLKASPYAILMQGLMHAQGSVVFSGPAEPCMAAFFPAESGDVLSPGDVVVAGTKPGTVRKSKSAQESSVIGVVVKNASIVLEAPEGYLPGAGPAEGFADPVAPAGMVLVALSGIVKIRSQGSVKPGDLLVTSGQPGKAEKMNADRYKPGTVFGRALDELQKGEGLIRSILSLA
jgi:hypothetical protein